MTSSSTPDRVTAWFEHVAPGYGQGVVARAVKAWEARAVMAATGPLDGPVLELGCGAGDYTRRLLHAGATAVVAVDRSRSMLAQIRDPRVRTVEADAASLALEDRFPLVFSAGMLEFVPDPSAVLRVARAHALPSARLVLFAPQEGALGERYRAWHRSHGVTASLFTADDLRSLAAGAGWTAQTVRAVWPFGLVGSFVTTPAGEG